MKQLVFIFCFTLYLLLVTTSCSDQALPKAPAIPSSVTRNTMATITGSGSTSQAVSEDISRVVTGYYQAIEKQNYDLAYSYLDPTETHLSHAIFSQEAQAQDRGEGKIQSYTSAIFPPMVVMTNMRVHIGPYHVHLQFKREGTSWKIVSLDGF